MKNLGQDILTEENKSEQSKMQTNNILHLVWRIAAVLVTLLLIIAAVYLILNWSDIKNGSIRSVFGNQSTKTDQFNYSGNTDSTFAMINGGLLVCTESELQYYNTDGEKIIEQTVRMNQPIIDSNQNYAVAYDAGGETLYVIHSNAITHSYTASSAQGILSARVNSNGYVTIVEQATGYKAAITVYDTSFEPVLTENISSAYVMDAILSQDNKTLAIVALNEDTDGFESTIIFYELKSGEEVNRCSVGSDIIIDLNWEKETLWAQGESGIYCVKDMSLAYDYLETTRYLQGFSLDGDGFAVNYFSKYQGGTVGSLTLLTEDGIETSIGVNEDVLSISAAGNYIAILTSSQLTVYNPDLTAYSKTENNGARRVIMDSNGTVLLITADSATVYHTN